MDHVHVYINIHAYTFKNLDFPQFGAQIILFSKNHWHMGHWLVLSITYPHSHTFSRCNKRRKIVDYNRLLDNILIVQVVLHVLAYDSHRLVLYKIYRWNMCFKHIHDVIIEIEISVLQCMGDTLQCVLVLTYLLYKIQRRCTKYCLFPYVL